MATEEWKKMSASPEKFLKAENYLTKPFSGVLEAIYPSQTQGEKPTSLIRLDFESGSSMSLFGLENRNEDGTYPFGLGAFIKSAEALGLEVQEAELDGVVQGIRLVENDTVLEKPKLWIKGIEEKKIGETTQTFYKWGILEKYEAIPRSAPPVRMKLGKYPPKPKPAKEQPPVQTSSALADALLEAGVAAGDNISDIFNVTFSKKYKVGEIRAALKTIGLEVAQNGIIQKQQRVI